MFESQTIWKFYKFNLIHNTVIKWHIMDTLLSDACSMMMVGDSFDLVCLARVIVYNDGSNLLTSRNTR